MGKELANGLIDEFEVKTIPCMAQPPTITHIGMAALLPHAENEIELVQTSNKKLRIKIGDNILKDRSDRLRYLGDVINGSFLSLKLNQLSKPSKKIREEVEGEDFIILTSTEIDRWGESGEGDENIRIYMDDVLERLGKAIRFLAIFGVTNLIIATDHGLSLIHI